MARRGGRRGSRGRSSSRRSRGKTGGVGSSRSKSKSNRSKSKSKSTGGSRGRSSNTRGGQSKANRNQNKKARRTVKSVKKAVSRTAKSIGKSLRGAAANAAGVQGKPKSKLQRQLSNLRSDIAQKSTKEARYNRRADRLKRQFGLDTRDMRNLKINVNVDRAAKHFGLDTNRFTKGLYGALPKSIRNFRFNTELGGKFRSPHKLGVRDGYRQPNRGNNFTNAIDRSGQYTTGQPIQRQLPIDTEQIPPQFGRAIRGIPGGMIPRIGQRHFRGGPQQDWLSQLYSSHNISGGKLDQGARDYWTNEAKTKGRGAVIDSIIGTSKAQGTYGGRKRPRRITTGSRPRGRAPWFGDLQPKTGKPNRGRSAPRVGHWGIGIPGHAGDMLRGHVDRKRAKRKTQQQNKAANKQYQSNKKSHESNKKRMTKSLASTIAKIRGGM